MNIDQRLHDAAAELRSELETLSPPEPRGRPSWPRQVAVVVGVAVVVVLIIGVSTVLRDSGRDVATRPEPTTVATVPAPTAAVTDPQEAPSDGLDPSVEPPEEYPQFVPVAPDVSAAIEGSTAISVSPDGVVWVTGGSGRRFGDNPTEPHFLNAIDGHTGELITRYEVGRSTFELAAGTERVWFGRTADGGVQTTSIGYLDRRTGEVVIEDVEHHVGSIILADDTGLTAYVLSEDVGVPVSRLGPGAVPAPLALDLDLGDSHLTGGVIWEGGLLIADSSGTMWRVDTTTDTAIVFAKVGDRQPDLLGEAAAPGGEAGVWLVTEREDGVRALLLDSDADTVADHLFTPLVMGNRVEALSTFRFDQSAYLMVSGGVIWFVTIDNEPTPVVQVPPSVSDCCFFDLKRSGTSLWIRGGDTGLLQIQLGQ